MSVEPDFAPQPFAEAGDSPQQGRFSRTVAAYGSEDESIQIGDKVTSSPAGIVAEACCSRMRWP